MIGWCMSSLDDDNCAPFAQHISAKADCCCPASFRTATTEKAQASISFQNADGDQEQLQQLPERVKLGNQFVLSVALCYMSLATAGPCKSVPVDWQG